MWISHAHAAVPTSYTYSSSTIYAEHSGSTIWYQQHCSKRNSLFSTQETILRMKFPQSFSVPSRSIGIIRLTQPAELRPCRKKYMIGQREKWRERTGRRSTLSRAECHRIARIQPATGEKQAFPSPAAGQSIKYSHIYNI
jgi:hypothetical protein